MPSESKQPGSVEQPENPSIPHPKTEQDHTTAKSPPPDGSYHGGADPDPSKS
jgi:hypothetical protein